MARVFSALLQDESGFIVSAELVLIATLLVIGMIVGLSEVQHAIVEELNDVAEAIGSVNQSFEFAGFSARKNKHQIKSFTRGSRFTDHADECDNNECDLSCDRPVGEAPKGGHRH
jgi:Flp pilus assembly pilin Flp